MNREENQFFDINKLPAEKGLLLFPISMSRILNRQSAPECLEDIRNFSPSKVVQPLIGLNFIYGDFLYLYSDKPVPELKNTFMTQTINHKNEMSKLLSKNNIEFQIQHAFNYMVWNQLYVGTTDFNVKFNKLKKMYQGDPIFQKYIEDDCNFCGRPMEDNQLNFFLEEFLMMYLMARGEVKLPNDYIENQQKWALICYPGNPLKGHIYVLQKNPFKLDWKENKYQNCFYNLQTKKLIEADRVNLETYIYE